MSGGEQTTVNEKGEPLSVGTRKQLFVDDQVVEAMRGLTRVLNEVEKHPDNPVMVPEHSWETKYHYTWDGGTVLYDEQDHLFKAWHGVAQTRICYATSEDGTEWHKPMLGLVEYKGSKDNNIVAWGSQPTVMLQPSRSDASERFLMGCLDPFGSHSTETEDSGGYAVLFSDDGIRWRPHPSNPVGRGGTDNGIMVYDHLSGQYVWVAKIDADLGERTCPTCGHGYHPPRRALAVAFSEDLKRWTELKQIMAEDETDRQIVRERAPVVYMHPYGLEWYANFLDRPDIVENWTRAARQAESTDVLQRITFPPAPGYPRMDYYFMAIVPYEGMYLALLNTLLITSPGPWYGARWTTDSPSENHGGNDGVMEVQLASSRDLVNRERLGERKPFIPLGRPGEWDAGMVTAFLHPIVRGDEIWLYYGGSSFSHMGQILWDRRRDFPGQQGLGLAKLRLDGFVSLDAQDGEGGLVTRPMVFEGRSLALNADASTGIVKVELLDASGQPVSPFTEDECDVNSFNSVDQKVTWDGNGDLSEWSGRPVRLRFHMRRARLYAFTFKQ